MSLTRTVASRWDEADKVTREWAVARLPKEDVDDWDGVDAYAVRCGDGLIEIRAEIGAVGDVWYCRTADEAGGSDDFPDRPYPDRESAVKAATEWVAEHDETPDLGALLSEVAESRGWDRATAERVVDEIASVPERSGMRLDVFANGETSMVSDNVYRYGSGAAFESYRGACSLEDAALQLLAGGGTDEDEQ